MRFTLRAYQEVTTTEVRRGLCAGRTSPLIVSPTGSGKTVIACWLIEFFAQQGIRTLFLAHRTELIEQCSDKLDDIGVRHGIIKAGIDRFDPSAIVQVGSVQTYIARQRFLSHKFGVIIIDEAHHAEADTYQQVIELNTNGRRPIVIGLTATPYRTDGKGLGNTFDSLIEVATTAQLIEWGYLVPTRLFRAQIAPDLSGLRTIGGDYDQDQLSKRMNRPRINGHIVSEYLRLAYGRVATYFAVNVEHSKAIAQAFRESGVKAEHLDGMTPAKERRAILNRQASGETTVLVNCGVLTEGYDCPIISVIGFARPTQSRGLWRQIIGRGLRLSPKTGKIDCLILDHAGVTDAHGYITDPDTISLAGGLEKPREAATVTCERCGAVLAGYPALCPSCGYILREPEQMEMGFADLGDARFKLSEDGEQKIFETRAPETGPRELYKPERPRLTRLRRRRAIG